jgi:single-strand DNA-binding protein
MRYTPSGQPVATFVVATNRVWTDASGQRQEEVEFHDVVAWSKLAEICSQVLAKGRKVYVEGRLKTRSWEGQDGAKHYKTEIIAENVIALDRPLSGADSSSVLEEAPLPAEAKSAGVELDEIVAGGEQQLSPEKEISVKKSRKKEPVENQPAADDQADGGTINIEDIPF